MELGNFFMTAMGFIPELQHEGPTVLIPDSLFRRTPWSMLLKASQGSGRCSKAVDPYLTPGILMIDLKCFPVTVSRRDCGSMATIWKPIPRKGIACSLERSSFYTARKFGRPAWGFILVQNPLIISHNSTWGQSRVWKSASSQSHTLKEKVEVLHSDY